MPTSRLPGPLTWDHFPAVSPVGSLIGSHQHFETALPIGFFAAAPARGRRKNGTKELTVLGDFAAPWSTAADEISAIKDGRWHPGTDDWLELASNSTRDRRKDFFTIGAVDEFVGLILLQPVGSIQRINIITHGASDFIAFSGTMDTDGGVSFDESLDIGTLAGLLEHGLVFRGKTLDWIEVERRFARDAEIVVYACNVGLSGDYLQDVADYFDVRVKAFDNFLDFHLTFEDGRVERQNIKVAKHEQGTGNAAESSGVKDFHNLTPNVAVKPELKDPFPD